MQIRVLLAPLLGLAAAGLWQDSRDMWAGPISLPAGPTADASDAIQQSEPGKAAIAAFRQGDMATVLRWLEKAREEHPELPPAEIMLANMFFSDEQLDKGREVLEQAAVKYPTDPEPHLIFGELAFRQGRWSDAQVQYERGGQLTNSFSSSAERKRQLKIRAIAGLANVAEARRQFDTAEKMYSALLKLEPKHPQAHFRLGNVLFAVGRPDDALVEFRAAADLVEAAPSPALTLAELYRQAGNISEAERWIKQAIEEAPDDVVSVLTMARWQLEARNDPEAAAKALDRAAQLDRESSDVRLLRGVIAWCQGDRVRAEQMFEAIVLQQPGNAIANCYLAAVLAEQEDADRRQRAWELAQLTAATNPRAVETTATLGWVAYHLGKFEQAEQQLQHVSAAAGAGRDTKYYLARTMFRRGQIAKAQQALQEALSTNGLFIHLREARQWQQELGEPGG
jgi:tetratricopeptide (TPR) repeat protein